MPTTIPGKDWKYLRNIHEELLATLFGRINRKAMEILQSAELSEGDKYRTLFRHIRDSDKIVANCFDDWRRSNIWLKLIEIDHNNLLSEDHLGHLSAETKQLIEKVKQFNKNM